MLKEITAPLLITKGGQRLGVFLAILFGVLLANTFIKLFFNVQNNTVVREAAVISLEDQAITLIQQIPQRHLLGNHIESSSILPITRLPFALIGILQSTSKHISSVIISESGKTGKYYQVGDILSSGIKISDIQSDGVIVNNNDRLEKLPLQRAPLVFQEAPKKAF